MMAPVGYGHEVTASSPPRLLEDYRTWGNTPPLPRFPPSSLLEPSPCCYRILCTEMSSTGSRPHSPRWYGRVTPPLTLTVPSGQVGPGWRRTLRGTPWRADKPHSSSEGASQAAMVPPSPGTPLSPVPPLLQKPPPMRLRTGFKPEFCGVKTPRLTSMMDS